MSDTDEWLKRVETYRYSQDDRTKQWKCEKILTPIIDAFLDDAKQHTLVVGPYNLELEPWHLPAIVSFRKYNLKVQKKDLGDDLSEITLIKQKMQK